MPIAIPADIKLKRDIVQGACTHPAGHCFGSDGGSGIPDNLKVAPGRGGEQRVWKLDVAGNNVVEDEWYERCQYCLKCNFIETNEEREKRQNL